MRRWEDGCIAETSNVKDECAEFIDWFLNSKEANEIMLGERGVPASASIRDYLASSGKLSVQQLDMFDYSAEMVRYCGDVPAPDPIGRKIWVRLWLQISADKETYHFLYSTDGEAYRLAATASTRFLSCEVAGHSFTGTVMGLYTASGIGTESVMEVSAFTMTDAR